MQPSKNADRTLLAFVFAIILIVLTPLPAVSDTLDRMLDERVKLQRNAPRGLEYVPTSSASGSAGTAKSLRVEPTIRINLDGDPFDNVYSSLLPVDMNGNGTFEYVHWNAHRIMRVFGRQGNKVWQVTNSTGRRQDWTRYMHRDQAAVLDLDNDGKDDILHCWQSSSTKTLVARDGATGKEIRSIKLKDQSTSVGAHCRIAVYYKQSDKRPVILLGETQAGGSSACGGRNYTDNWARVAAFDMNLRFLWNINTCDAGHMTAAVDSNKDGYAEYVFVGKYAIEFNGKVRCTLSGWNKSDHVDAVRLAQLDPASSTLTVIAIGRTGGGAFRPKDCSRIWSVPVSNPQEMAIAQLDPAPAPLSITVTNRSGASAPVVTTVLNAKGQKVRTFNTVIEPMQNAQLDGYRRNDEVVGMFGQVFDGKGNMLLSRNWYWNLKGSRVKEKVTNNVYDKWAAYPVLFDMDSDGKEEFVAWSQSLIVEGKLR